MDLKKYDKSGKSLNIMPLANKNKQRDYHGKWLEDNSRFEPTPEDIKCELQLSALSVFEPLDGIISYRQFEKEIAKWENAWVPYLRREGISNDRDGLLLVGLEGDTPSDSLSMPEARKRTGKKLKETDFTYKTELYYDLKCLHPILENFDTLGRTMLVKVNQGGWFPPHKDSPMLTRDSIRIVIFLGPNTDVESYQWHMDGKAWPIAPNRAYYVDTRKTHRTNSWTDGSIHCVVNVPKTWENVLKIMSMTKDF
tara:strand:- start:10163 stop:10921 length:759 start_codon:yes stop_codon:yes gene_type:complete